MNRAPTALCALLCTLASTLVAVGLAGDHASDSKLRTTSFAANTSFEPPAFEIVPVSMSATVRSPRALLLNEGVGTGVRLAGAIFNAAETHAGAGGPTIYSSEAKQVVAPAMKAWVATPVRSPKGESATLAVAKPTQRVAAETKAPQAVKPTAKPAPAPAAGKKAPAAAPKAVPASAVVVRRPVSVDMHGLPVIVAEASRNASAHAVPLWIIDNDGIDDHLPRVVIGDSPEPVTLRPVAGVGPAAAWTTALHVGGETERVFDSNLGVTARGTKLGRAMSRELPPLWAEDCRQVAIALTGVLESGIEQAAAVGRRLTSAGTQVVELGLALNRGNDRVKTVVATRIGLPVGLPQTDRSLLRQADRTDRPGTR